MTAVPQVRDAAFAEWAEFMASHGATSEQVRQHFLDQNTGAAGDDVVGNAVPIHRRLRGVGTGLGVHQHDAAQPLAYVRPA